MKVFVGANVSPELATLQNTLSSLGLNPAMPGALPTIDLGDVDAPGFTTPGISPLGKPMAQPATPQALPPLPPPQNLPTAKRPANLPYSDPVANKTAPPTSKPEKPSCNWFGRDLPCWSPYAAAGGAVVVVGLLYLAFRK